MAITQFSLDEIIPDVDHAHAGVIATEDGYRGRCACGWIGPEVTSKAWARGRVSSHLSRTIQGQLLVKTLRKH